MQDELFNSLAHLAIPLTFITGAKGLQYLNEKKANKKKSTHAQHGGEQGTCFLCMQDQQQGGARELLKQEIQKIASDLRELLAEY